MELEYAKELDRILGALQGPISERFKKGNEKFGGETISEITKLQAKNGSNQHLVIIKDWDIDYLVEELQISRVNLCGYLEVLANKALVHLIKGGPTEIFAYASATITGIHFYRNGGFTKVAVDEIAKEKKEEEVLDKQLEVAKISADAAKDSSLFSKYLLWITAINVLAVLFTTFFQVKDLYNKRNLEKPAAKIEENFIRIPSDTLKVRQE